MAETLGFHEDVSHWNATANFDDLQTRIENNWEIDREGMWGTTQNGFGWPNFAFAANSMFPREYVKIMSETWLDNSVSVI